MNESKVLVEAFAAAQASGERCALATIVRVEGSAYRRPGARMLIAQTGRTTGMISGGCLDGDVRERAGRVIQTGRPALVRYDTTTDAEIVWGLGLGCNGVVDVLIEPVTESTADLMRFLEEAAGSPGRSALAIVIRSDSRALGLGSRVLLSSDGRASLAGAKETDTVISEILADLQVAIRSGVSSVTRYGSDATVETFVEIVDPQVPLVIFGAGVDAVPLVSVARQLGWHTTVVDTQARSRSMERFKEADAVILCRPEDAASRVTLTERSVAVLMTHNYTHDLELLPFLLNSPTRYIGCLGPRRRTERLLSELPGEPGLSLKRLAGRLHAPIGLDVGAETPSEISVSIGAEILAAMNARSAGFLSHGDGSIHARTQRHAIDARTAGGDVPLTNDLVRQTVDA
jgi:xanthine dehydrogenase accessory factor